MKMRSDTPAVRSEAPLATPLAPETAPVVTVSLLALLKILRRSLPMELTSPVAPTPEATDAEFASQMASLTSTPVPEDIAAKLNLDNDPEFNLASGASLEPANPFLVRALKAVSNGLAAMPAYSASRRV